MQYTAKPSRPVKPVQPVRPGQPSAPPARANWLQNTVSGLGSLPTKARRLFADGYRIPADEAVAGRYLVFKPKNDAVTPDYTLDVWNTGLTEPRYRYRCTCQFYRTIAKYTVLRPECKHGMAVVLRHENDVARVPSAEALLARVAHIEERGGSR